MKSKYSYIDLFAGCGGLSLGLHNAGWKGLFAIEKNPDAFSTLKHNLIDNKKHFDWPSWLPVLPLEIDKVLEDYKEQLINLKGTVDLVAGGPPCQGFSTAGRRKEGDVRNGLVRSYLKFIMYTRPKVIFFENVKGFTLEFKKNRASLKREQMAKGMAYSEYVLRVLRFFGYDVEGRMIDFSKYGVPQKRTRFILVGINKQVAINHKLDASLFFKLIAKKKKAFLSRKGLPQSPTLGNAISDLLKSNGVSDTPDRVGFHSGIYSVAPKSKYQKHLRYGIDVDRLPDSHSFANHKPEIVQRFKYFLKHQTANKNISAEIRARLKISKHTIIPLAKEGKAPTITTLPDDYIHYSEPRILTVREYARIQSFPDWFLFQGKYTSGGKNRTKEVPRYSQIGNAIPPLFGEQSGLVLKVFLK